MVRAAAARNPAAERRVPFALRTIARGTVEVFKTPITLGYMLATGIIFGAFISYLSTAQQIFQEQYQLGKLFPVFFGALAAAIGVASFVNGGLVMRFGMQRLSRIALLCACALSITAFIGAWLLWRGHPPLAALMAYLLGCFFFNGILFGNFNARAMEPMGRIAGLAAAITGSVSGLVALVIGTPFAAPTTARHAADRGLHDVRAAGASRYHLGRTRHRGARRRRMNEDSAVPLNSAEVTRDLQDRFARFARDLGVISAVMLVASVTQSLFVGPDAAPISVPSRVVHFGATVLALGTWRVLRGKARPARVIHTLDATLTVVLCTCWPLLGIASRRKSRSSFRSFWPPLTR